ncbi:hypothetical protein MGN70_004369 [Eutypa lata]|nr:hypothetical protein MGN70_004369 [Eutypa lata]
MSNLEGSGRRVDGVQKLLKSLHFDTLEYRHANIDEAHPKTFRCVFDCRLPNRSKNNKFTDWLRNDGNIFWIQGKAGSGKSTLMKFLCQHQRLRRELKHWSGEEKLVIGRYFFWNSGTKLEKSQEGLLRSLLFDILRVCPEIDVSVLSLGCGTGVDGCTISSWTREELLGIFEHLQYVDVSIKFCFFIDGLDEYKGDPLELLGTVQRLASLPNIKVCTSSRPWTHFVDALGGHQKPHLKLEDLTKSDIQRYVSSRLYSNRRFMELKNHDTAYVDIANQIVSHAQGVFLWVVLVVRSFPEGATYADSLEDMRRRLEMFPKDLESYFQRIIDDIPEVYRLRTAVTFQIALATEYPLPLSTYYFIDEMVSGSYFALRSKRKYLSSMELRTIRRKMTARLDGRCRRLLEVVRSTAVECPLRIRRVDFLHRTAKDFLLSQGHKSVTMESISADFDPYSTLCHAFLAEVKFTRGDLSEPVDDFMQYASLVEGAIVKTRKINLATNEVAAEYHRYIAGSGHSSIPFLIALRKGLRWYVQQQLTDSYTSTRDLNPHSLLEQTCSLLNDTEIVEAEWLPSIFQCILDHSRDLDSQYTKAVGAKFVKVWLPQAMRSTQQKREQIHEILGILI